MFDPVDFLHLAEKLMKERNEASIRTSISRAYYASFLIAKDKLSIMLKPPDVHKEVIKQLYKLSPIAGNSLHNLRRLRNTADYDIKTKVTANEGDTALKLAKLVILEMEKIKI